MAQLRLVGVSEDGERLVLTDDDGVQHTIVIDERLRAGVNGHLSRLGQLTMALESRISPREIQNRVRSGESAEHVADSAGVPLERVLRFVGPVLRERATAQPRDARDRDAAEVGSGELAAVRTERHRGNARPVLEHHSWGSKDCARALHHDAAAGVDEHDLLVGAHCQQRAVRRVAERRDLGGDMFVVDDAAAGSIHQ